MSDLIKLNLGCGKHHKAGYVNVDKYGNPDVRWDLETFPWPWDDNSVEEVSLNHVLEHLGPTTDIYFGIIKELYRVCTGGASIHITAPHPRHEEFISDPTHVRAITPDSFSFFSKAENKEWVKGGFANSLLALHLDVDFQIVKVDLILDPIWQQKLTSQKITEAELAEALLKYNNVAKEVKMVIKVIK